MERLFLYLISFTFVYLIYFLFVIKRSKKQKQYRKSSEVLYLEKRYKLDIDKINIKKLSHILALANAFIIANVVLIIDFINEYFTKLFVGFILIIPMILIVYHLVYKYLEKSGK